MVENLTEEKLQYIQSTLLHFSDAIRNDGKSLENGLLDAFTIALAFYNKNNKREEIANFKDYDKESLNCMLHDFFINLENSEGIPSINVQNPAIRGLIFCFENIDLSNKDLIEILDWIIQSTSFNNIATPSSVAHLLLNVAKVQENEKVLDPAMGTGGFFSALRKEGKDSLSFAGIELNPQLLYISNLYKYLLNDQKTNLLKGSAFHLYEKSLISPVDIVICNPPVKRIPLNEAKDRYSSLLGRDNVSSEMSLNFIELSLQCLKENGRAIFLVNMKPLFASGEIKKIRQYWIESGLLKKVIGLPSKLLSQTSAKCAILVFEKNELNFKNEKNTIRFVKADDCYLDEKRFKRVLSKTNIQEIMKRVTAENNDDFSKDINYETLLENDFSLVPDLYLGQKIGNFDLKLSEIWTPLGQIADVLRGTKLSHLENGEEPIIQGRDLRVDKINIEDLECKDLSPITKEIQYTQANDILLQRIGERPAAYYIENETNIAISDTILIIRFKEFDPLKVKFICQFLNSEEGIKRIKDLHSYSVIQTQSVKIIKELKVPVPEQKIINLVEEMNQIELSLRVEYENAAQLRKSIFGNFEEAELSTNFKKIKLASLALENSLQQKNDITYKIKSFYPFPLAYPYRNIYLEREYTAIYERQMKFGEYILSFLASIGLSLIYEFKEQINKPLKNITEELKNFLLRGISPGDWRKILQLVCSALKDLEENLFIDDFTSLWFKGRGNKETEFAQNTLNHIVRKLNNFKHSRGPVNIHEYKDEGENQKKLLDNILEDLEFLGQCEIILIDNIDTEWSTGNILYTASLLKGDHPAFEKITFSTHKRLSKDKLYIKFHDQFISLYPFLSCIYNTGTKKVEIFSFDKISDNKLMLKSFESGTSVNSEIVNNDFKYWLKYINE
ncbi:N-6 DNA methylase [Acinetobacter baumannii]